MTFVVYGATGYTGRLIAREAVARGHRPLLAGRNRLELEALGGTLGLPTVVAALDVPEHLDRLLVGQAAVIHCAGPFAATWRPMVEACLRNRASYLDITGEIEVFESLARLDREARAAGITLLPGTGFDVVPSDCLARHLKERLPGASALTLAFTTRGGMSRGTALTTIRNLGRPGAIRRDGRITPVPAAWKTRSVDFGRGPRPTVLIPWGDVATAWYSTGIGDIEVYMALSLGMIRLLRGLRWIAPLLATRPVRALLAGIVRRRLTGPSDAARQQGGVVVWGEVTDDSGHGVRARLEGPEGYTMTAMTAVRAVERVITGRTTPGFQTPARAFGADFILEIPGVVRSDLP